jgi:hypothetical protein
MARGSSTCHSWLVKVINTPDNEDEREALVRFVDRFRSLPARGTGQRTSEFFALINEALKTGEIDSRLRVITSPRLNRTL